MPKLQFPPDLPVSASAERIAATIAESPVVIVCGETGSGKTTQLPKICALAGRGVTGRIGHTQPRRIAATSVARRIAQELGTPLGVDVGYKVRFGEELQAGARFKLMTDGILLAETQGDRELRQYDTIIIDEAHERSLNIDFLLGYLKGLIDGPRRDDLKVVITSATIDAQRFARHFAIDGRPAPVVEVSGRLYPVEVRYEKEAADGPSDDEDDESDLPSRIERALVQAWDEGPGDVLVFLPGEREIRDTSDHLRRAVNSHRISRGDIDIVPLFARLSAEDQQRVFSESRGRRVVLATNVAETSLTVPGIRYVIDAGLARVKRYRLRGKVEQLQIEEVSQAAANQRAGRCGRVSNGVCIRLYSDANYKSRPEFTDPEVLRSSLASVILRMKSLRLGDVEQFPFVDAPPGRAINDGYALLLELGAVDDKRRLTRTGEQLARLPVDPRIGRMLLAGHELGCLAQVLVIASALSTQDPRDRPMDAQQAADEAHKPFVDKTSDFMGQLRLWYYWKDADAARASTGESRGALNRRLQKQFLSVRRLREWSDVHRQLSEAVRELKWKSVPGAGEQESVEPEVVHKALLHGLLGNLGNKPPDEKQYLGTHQTRFVIHPSSSLTRKQPRWLMAAEMVDTGRLYARTVAGLQPGWIEQAARHLIRRHWSEPFWSSGTGQAMRYESGVLYGLTVYSQRRVPLATYDPVVAREMFVRCALAEGDWGGPRGGKRPAFMVHNQKLVESIEKLEQKIRRPDLLVDMQFLFDWFDARVGGEVVDARSFDKWYRSEVRAQPELLKLTRDELLRKDAAGVASQDFPRQMAMRGIEFSLDYRFEPGAVDDGVTMTVPLSLLNQVDANRAEWLVPGLLADKVQALVKSLPQRMRRHLVPVPEYVIGFCARHKDAAAQSEPLVDSIRADARERHAVQAQLNDFRPEVVPKHLVMNLKLVDDHGRQI
ncbi:MAG: ATP-dependent RNA helicase HrpA, partial [Burkholderiaceae bacterium]